MAAAAQQRVTAAAQQHDTAASAARLCSIAAEEQSISPVWEGAQANSAMMFLCTLSHSLQKFQYIQSTTQGPNGSRC